MRVILNEMKRETSFDKFIYSIENKDIEMLMLDREHFNTFQLGNKIKNFIIKDIIDYKYFLVLCVIFISLRIFFIYANKRVYLKLCNIIFWHFNYRNYQFIFNIS